MDGADNDFKGALEIILVEHGLSYQIDSYNIYSIVPKNKPDQIRTAQLIGSEQIEESKHGSKNNTKIKAIAYFIFDLSPVERESDFYIFTFNNTTDNKVEFIIIPTDEFKHRIASRKCNMDKDQQTDLKFWLLPDNLVFDTTNLGAEGEWWFIAGRMAKNSMRDYTIFLNNWCKIS